jgi:hypothetical protein
MLEPLQWFLSSIPTTSGVKKKQINQPNPKTSKSESLQEETHNLWFKRLSRDGNL